MDYLKIIIPAVLGLIEAIAVALGIVSIPKKKNADLTAKKEYCSSLLPEVIKLAETNCSTGAIKKEFVVSACLSACESKFGEFKTKDKITITKYISESVESILSTPQKKLTQEDL